MSRDDGGKAWPSKSVLAVIAEGGLRRGVRCGMMDKLEEQAPVHVYNPLRPLVIGRGIFSPSSDDAFELKRGGFYKDSI